MVPVDELFRCLPRHSELEAAYAAASNQTERLVLAATLGMASARKLKAAVQRTRLALDALSPGVPPPAGWPESILLGRPARRVRSSPPRHLLVWWLTEGQHIAGTDELPIGTLIEHLTESAQLGGARAAQIALLVYDRPVLPFDRPVLRVLVRHGWIDPAPEALAEQPYLILETHSADDVRRLYFALRETAEKYCGVTSPKCTNCPLAELLPEGGPLEPVC